MRRTLRKALYIKYNDHEKTTSTSQIDDRLTETYFQRVKPISCAAVKKFAALN